MTVKQNRIMMYEVLNEILSHITKRKLCLNEREEGTINAHDADEKSLNKEIKIHWTEGISVYQQCNFCLRMVSSVYLHKILDSINNVLRCKPCQQQAVRTRQRMQQLNKQRY
jgi:hypothetical protein